MAYLREAGYGITSLDATGATGRAHLIYTIITCRAAQWGTFGGRL